MSDIFRTEDFELEYYAYFILVQCRASKNNDDENFKERLSFSGIHNWHIFGGGIAPNFRNPTFDQFDTYLKNIGITA